MSSIRRRLGDARGAIGQEYAAMIAVAALVCAAIFAGIVVADVPAKVCRAVSDIFKADLGCAGGATAGPPKTDKDYEPEKCKANEKGEKYTSKVKIFFIEIGNNAGFVVTEYSDGSVEMTATDGGSLGVTGGLGADATAGAAKVGAKVDFGGGLKFDYGSTWKFDDRAEADAMREQLNAYLLEQQAAKWAAMDGVPYINWNPTDPPKPPTYVTSSIALTGEVKGSIGISTTGQTSSGTFEIPEAEIAGKLDGEAKWVTRTNTETGEVTYTTDLTLNGAASSNLWLTSLGVKGTDNASMSLTRDKDGKVTNVTFVTTAEGSVKGGGKAGGKGETTGGTKGGGSIGGSESQSQATVITTSIPIDPNDAGQQQIVQDFMGGTSNYSTVNAFGAGTLNPERADPNDPFQQLAHTNGTVSAVTYDKVEDVVEFGANVKLGFALGFDFSLSNTESNAVAASYMGAPDATGTRGFVPYTTCVP